MSKNTQFGMGRNTEGKKNGIMECWNRGMGEERRNSGILECWDGGKMEQRNRWNDGRRGRREYWNVGIMGTEDTASSGAFGDRALLTFTLTLLSSEFIALLCYPNQHDSLKENS